MANAADESTASRIAGLKPCPFCGGEPRTLKCFDGIIVHCQSFDCSTAPSTMHFESLDAAIAAWNTRAHPSPDPDGWIATSEIYRKALEYILILNNLYLGSDFKDGAKGSNYAHVRDIAGQMVDAAESALLPTPPVREQP